MSRRLLPLLLLAGLLAGCTAAPQDDDGTIRVIATTTVLGAIVEEVLAPATATEVEVLLPAGADPHGYAPSAADALALREADVVYAVGLGLEEALDDALASAEEDGVRVVRLGPRVDPLPLSGPLADLHEAHGDEGHGNEEEHDEEGHDEDEGHADEGEDHADEDGEEVPLDPHVWLDPMRAAQLGVEVASVHATVAPDDAEAVMAAAADLEQRLVALDAELAELVAAIPMEDRRLVTNHEALGYLAARYDFEVVATVLPGTTADVDVTARAFTDLVELLRDTGVPAVFAETTSSDRLARSLAEEVGDVEVVELYTDALGEPGSGADTIEGMLRTDVERIVDALT